MVQPQTQVAGWIDQPSAFQSMLADLLNQPVIAVDTESNSLFAYQEQVCLIQFSTGEADYLVDPLALEDLSGLGEVFADSRIEKVFHAAEYDLICLTRDFGFNFTNLFDTMIAGRTLGREAVGLSSMLEAEFGITLDKRCQRADWSQRPLPQRLQEYARLDTHYLIPLRELLESALKNSGKWELAQEDFRRMHRVNLPVAGDVASQCWRAARNHYLSPLQTAVLKALCEYRDQQAQRANLPLFKVFSDQALVQVALVMPEKISDFNQIEGVSPRILHRHSRELLKIVNQTHIITPLQRTSSRRPSEEYSLRLEALRNWRKKAGEALGIGSDVVLPKDLLEGIAAVNPRSPQELEDLMREVPWRFERFGSQIFGVLNQGDQA